jgi:hypothetical protein
MRFSRIACCASLEDRRGECKRSQDGEAKTAQKIKKALGLDSYLDVLP